MNVLIHTDQYYPFCGAGAYRMKILADVLMLKGHNVTVVASSANITNRKKEKLPEKVIYSPTFRMKKKTVVRRLLNNVSFAVTSVFASFGTGRADIVITTSPPLLINLSGWMIAKLKRARLVYDVRDIWPDVALEMESFSKDSVYFKLFSRIANFMYKHTDLVTTVSPGKVEKIVSHLEGLKGRKNTCQSVKLVENGFDERILDSSVDKKIIENYSLDKTPTCVYIGNIGLAQGLGALLDVAEKTSHKDVKFLFFGSGAETELLKNMASERNLSNVQFCGVLEHDKVYTVLKYATLSFVCLKSVKMTDSIPTKMYEALGVGCPVLLVAKGDSCKILQESGLGKCVAPDDADGLLESFESMIDESKIYKARKEFSQKLMKEKYSRQKISLNFEKMLCELVK